MAIIPKDQLKALIKEYNLKDAKDIQGMLKTLFGDTLKEMFEAVILFCFGFFVSGKSGFSLLVID